MTEGVIRGSDPPDCNPQQRLRRCEEHFCGAEFALGREDTFTSAGAKMRTLRICRPGALKGREANP